MKRIYFLFLIIFALSLTTNIQAQSKSFLAMTEQEKAEYVAVKVDEITDKISGKKYPFDANFQAQVSRSVEAYARRAGNNQKTGFGQDLNLVMQRGSEYAPTINGAFDKNGVSRLSGLYISMIESEFNNSPPVNDDPISICASACVPVEVVPKTSPPTAALILSNPSLMTI